MPETVMQKDAATAAFRERHAARSARLAGPGWLDTLRADAWGAFGSHGFPTTRLEAWKKTDVRRIVRTPYGTPDPTAAPALDAGVVEGLMLGDEAAVAVCIDGRFVPALSRLDGLPAGITVAGLADTLAADPDSVTGLLGSQAVWDAPQHAFTALNTALFDDGVVVRADKGAVLDGTVHIVHLVTGDAPVAVFPRTLVAAGENAGLTVVETFHGTGDAATFTDAVAEVVTAQGARVDHIKVQRERLHADHVGGFFAHEARDAHVGSLVMSLGGRLVRNEVVSTLDGAGAGTRLDGLFLVAGKQHMDNHTTVDHAKPHGTSQQRYKGVLDGEGHGVFTGYVHVAKGATKSDSDQENRNLVLSRKALVDTTPQLEIYNDDVTCAHGSTIGRLDEDAVFFLRTRGIDEAAARRMLTLAFAGEVLEDVRPEALRAGLEALVAEWFASGREDAMAAAEAYADARSGDKKKEA